MTVNVTLVGNATSDPDLKFTPKGDAAASFTLAVNERVKQGDEWVDGEAVFYRVKAWRKNAEQAAEHVKKGDRLIVVGKLKPSQYETREGEKRTSLDVTADEIGLSVKWMKPGTQAKTPAVPNVRATAQDEIPPF